MGFVLKSLSSRFLALVVVAIAVLITFGERDKEQITFENLGDEEKAILEKFKVQVIPKIPPSSNIQNYINDDLYFFNWLQATSFDLEAAEKMFTDNLKWREAENIDGIDKENWTEMQKDVPLFFDTVAKDGTPTTEGWLNDWNTGKVVSEGKSKLMGRFLIRMMEVQTRNIFEARTAGRNVSQINDMATLKNYDFNKLVCLECLSIYSEFFSNQAQHYPNLFKNLILLDMSPTLEVVLQILRPFMSSETRRSLKTYSLQEDWMELLDQMYDKDQMSLRFGGTIVRNF